MHISTDKTKIEELLSRGTENIYPKEDFLRSKLLSGEQITLYTGYDPTGPTLHIGHGITMLKLRQFQDLGHKIIMLIGDFTGMIGDPTDKGSARKQLTKEEVLENCKAYQEQASHILNFEGENPVEVKYNSQWLASMTFADVVELTSHFTVQRMFERDMFQQRIKDEKPIYLHEFLYPVMQGYDCVAMDVDGEVGGNDQTFNMLAGRSLMKDLKKKEKFVVTTKLLVDSTGKKMGKSTGNAISLNDEPKDIFGKVMRWTDDMILLGYELCTTISADEINSIKEKLEAGENPRDAKLRLAFEVTKTFLGEESATIGKEHFATVIQGNQKPTDIQQVDGDGKNIVDFLVDNKLVQSRSEVRRLIAGKGVKCNDVAVEGVDHILKSGDVVQKGKRFFLKVA